MTIAAAQPADAPLVIVAVSGGVDSAVACLLLKEQGYRVQGLFMTNWEEDETGYCTAAEDFQDARRVCEMLEIPLHRVNFAAAYRERVFSYFLREYRSGRTPNPDVLCNREIKFGVCIQYARRLGAQIFATGHYARIDVRDGQAALLKGRDSDKDQSYFLHAIDPALLPQLAFPIGGLTKPEVRSIAQRAVLPVSDKKDSTGICFIGERPFRNFLASYLPAQPGAIETPDGQVLGKHGGLMHYTLGQRHGLRIGGLAAAADDPWYVAAKDLERNVLVVVQGHDHPLLMADAVLTEAAHWLRAAPGTRFSCTVKTRYRQTDQPCVVEVGGKGLRIEFAEPQRAPTPGQFAVLYDGDVCLGGAVIAESLVTVPRAAPQNARIGPRDVKHSAQLL